MDWQFTVEDSENCGITSCEVMNVATEETLDTSEATEFNVEDFSFWITNMSVEDGYSYELKIKCTNG